MAHAGLTFESLSPSIASGWDAVVCDSDDGWPFALSCWQRLILGVREWELSDDSFAVFENGKLVGVMPLQFNPGSKAMASSGWGGSGPVLATGISANHRRRLLRAALEHAEALARERSAEKLEFWTSPVTRTSIDAAWGVNPFVFFGFDDRSGISQVIDLGAGEEDLWKDVSETARHACRRAESLGYTVDEVPWPDMLERYYEVHVATYRRTGVAPHPKTYFSGISSEIWTRQLAHLWAARSPSGAPIAFHNSLWFHGGGFYHTGCSTEEALRDGANYLLFWKALLGARSAGIRWYDCGEIVPAGAAGKSAGLTTFKSKFGGEPHRFFKCAKALAGPKADQGPEGPRATGGIKAAVRGILGAVSPRKGSG